MPASTDIGTGELVGYFSADYFIKLLKATGKNLTAQSFQQTAAKYTYEIKDVIGPTYYPQGFQVGPSCTVYSQSNGTAWEVAVPYDCSPPAQEKGRQVQHGALPEGHQVARRTGRPGELPGAADDRTVEGGAQGGPPGPVRRRSRNDAAGKETATPRSPS